MDKVYAIRNKETNEVEELVQAKGKSDVVRYLATRVKIDVPSSVEVMDLVVKGVKMTKLGRDSDANDRNDSEAGAETSDGEQKSTEAGDAVTVGGEDNQ